MATYFVNKSGNNTTGSSWANAYTTMAACIARPPAAGDTIFVGDDHTESQATTYSWTFPGGVLTAPYYIACVDHTVASPGFADLRQGVSGAGAFTSTGNTTLLLYGNFYMYGLYFMLGTGAAGTSAQLNASANTLQVYEKCYVGFGHTGASIAILLNGAGAFTRLIDCTFKLGAASQIVQPRNSRALRCNIDTVAGVQPTQIITLASGRSFFEDCNFINCTSATFVAGNPGGQVGYVQFKRCRLPNIPLASTTSSTATESYIIDTVQCDTGSVIYRNDRSMIPGTLTTNAVAARVTGAVDSGNPVSWKITTITTVTWYNPFYTNPIVVWNDNVTTPVSITVEGIADPRDFPTTLPKNDEIWIEANYHGNSNVVGKTISGTKANPWDTASVVLLTASTEDWTAAVPTLARATAYANGSLVKVASNPGRIFVATTGGTSHATTEPAGFATAVDGGVAAGGIVDGSSIWRAMWRFKQTITTPAAPNYEGYIYVTVKVGKGSIAQSIYIDPFVTLS